MGLPHTPTELVLSILFLCDISTVISVGQTNRRLHVIASSAVVWRSLVEDLKRRVFLDRESFEDIHAMSIDDLIGIVKSLLRGPDVDPASILPEFDLGGVNVRVQRKTKKGDTLPQPRIHSCVALRLPIPPLTQRLKNEIVLLRGGKYLLFNKGSRLECWSVPDQTMRWSYPPRSQQSTATRIVAFAAEMLDGGTQANLVIFRREFHLHVDVLTLDLTTGIDDVLWSVALSVSQSCYTSATHILGAYSCVCLFDRVNSAEKIFIFNWQIRKFCEIERHLREDTSDVALVPGHLLIASPQQLGVYALASLSENWCNSAPGESAQSTNPIRLSNVPPVILRTLESVTGSLTTVPEYLIRNIGVHLAVFESPLAQGTFRVWLYPRFPDIINRYMPALRGRMYGFHLHGAAQVTLAQRCCFDVPALTTRAVNARYCGVMYSGHALVITASGEHIVCAPQERTSGHAPLLKLTLSEMNEEVDWPHVSAYSGAVACVLSDAVVIRYLK